jgi:hypothetical protein
MKFIQIFTKTPNYKKFAYAPRFYNAEEEERKERESRIKHELERATNEAEKVKLEEELTDEQFKYRERIAGSFRNAKKTAPVQSDPSVGMLRLIILLVISIGLIAYLQYGKNALYAIAVLFVPLYLYSKFRGMKKR